MDRLRAALRAPVLQFRGPRRHSKPPPGGPDSENSMRNVTRSVPRTRLSKGPEGLRPAPKTSRPSYDQENMPLNAPPVAKPHPNPPLYQPAALSIQAPSSPSPLVSPGRKRRRDAAALAAVGMADYDEDAPPATTLAEAVRAVSAVPEGLGGRAEPAWAKLVDWLQAVHSKFELSGDTLLRTVELMQTYLKAKHMPLSRLQLLACGAVLLACPDDRCARERYLPTVSTFAHLTDKAYSTKELAEMEVEVMWTSLGVRKLVEHPRPCTCRPGKRDCTCRWDVAG